MRQITFFALPLALLAACATPQERCIAVASKDLHVVRALIAETTANLDRGYAIGEKSTPVFTTGFCDRNGISQVCLTQTIKTVEEPVSINATLERQKLRDLKAKEMELAQRSVLAAQQCQVDYP